MGKTAGVANTLGKLQLEKVSVDMEGIGVTIRNLKKEDLLLKITGGM